jgi:cysteine-rich repeat protein
MSFAQSYGKATCVVVVAIVGCGNDRQESASATVELRSTPPPGEARRPIPVVRSRGPVRVAARMPGTRLAYRSHTDENRPPIATDDNLVIDEDHTGVVNVVANDSDPDGDSLTVSIVTPVSHGTTMLSNGVVSYKPNLNYNGTDSLIYQVADGHSHTATATLRITVRPVNDRPSANHDFLTVAQGQTGSIDVTANDTDPDGDPLTVTSITRPANGTASLSGRIVSYTSAATFTGQDSLQYTISDGHGGTSTASLFVTVTAPTQDHPPIAVDDDLVTAEDTEGDVFVLGNDSDPDGDALTVTAFSQPAHGSVAISAGFASYVPDADYNGLDSFTYTIADPSGATASATVHITVSPVDDAPVASDDATSLEEDTSATVDVVANDRDLDGDPLVVISVTQPTSGTVAIASSREVTYTPNPNFAGSDSFTYTIADPSGETSTATVTVSVSPVNDPPVAVDDSATLLEDASVAIDVLANDSDPDRDPLMVASVTQPLNGSAALLDGNLVLYTPAPNFHGTDTFSYTIVDPSGATATAVVTLEVVSVNDPPIAVDDAASLDEDTSVTVDVVANDRDVDHDPLAILSITQPAHGFAMAIDDHRITYVPAPDYNGPDALTYTISDGSGGTATAELALEVASVNDAPVAVDDAASLDEDTSVTVDVVANDRDVDRDPLTVTSLGTPMHGTAAIVDGHDVLYTPAANYNGPDSVAYTISDGQGGQASATLALDVISVNDPPVAVDDAATLDEDTALAISVTANDSDVDHDALTVVAVTQPAHGTAVASAGQVTYTPDANFHGSDRFTYTIDDGHGLQASATVTLTILSVNDAPVAVDRSATAFDGDPVAIALLASDVDGDPLTFAIGQGPTHGTVSAVIGGTVTYTPAAGFTGTDSFTYTASDGQASSAPATVAVSSARSVCGNGVREGHEECDDGNTAAGDGCEATCKLTCGAGTGADRSTVDPVSGHCFVAYDGVQHSYQEAAALCSGFGGHLASLASASEDAAAFAAVRAGDRPFLGGDDIAIEGAFSWTTGEPFGYTHFATGKPDGAGHADCLEYLADGTWSDAACASTTGALCELEVATTTPAFATGGTGTRSVAVGDLNGDGHADLAAVNQTSNTLGVLLGNGAGGFVLQASYPTGTGPIAVAAGDFDGDGHPDLAVLNATASTLSILRGSAAGTFTAAATVGVASSATALAAGDFDGDGVLDLVVGASGTLQVLHGNGSGGFALATSLVITGAPAAIAVGDFDRDGDLDLAITTPLAVLVVMTGGGGILGTPISLAPSTSNGAITAADLDGDGNIDLAVVNGASNLTVYFGATGAVFPASTTLTLPAAPQAVAAGDFDGDGDPDLAVVTGGYATLLHGSGRTFTPAGPAITTGGTGADFAVAAAINADGAQDLVVANGATGTAGLLLGGPGGFIGAHAVVTGGTDTAQVSADFNEDGIPDLAVVDTLDGKIFIYLQTAAGALVPGVTLTTNASAGSTFPIAVDLNHDGHIDLAVANVNFGSLAIARGAGDGTFTQPSNVSTPPGPHRFAVGDFNGDGNLDIAVPDNASITLLNSNSGGGLGRGPETMIAGTPQAVVVADFNGDHKPDLAVITGSAPTVIVLLGNGDNTFTQLPPLAIPSGGQSLVAADLDGDGFIDLATANLADGSVSVLAGTGTGGFAAATRIPVGAQPAAIAAADVDGDGRLDLVVANQGDDTVTVLHNDAGGGFVGTTVTAGGAPAWLTVVDLDHDGHPDITVATGGPFVTTLFSGR